MSEVKNKNKMHKSAVMLCLMLGEFDLPSAQFIGLKNIGNITMVQLWLRRIFDAKGL